MIRLLSLAVAYTFGIGSLWIDALWPFAVVQAVLLVLTCAWLGQTARHGRAEVSPWLLLPFGFPLIGAMQLLTGSTENLWTTHVAMLEWFTHACAALLAFYTILDERNTRPGLRMFAIAAGVLAAAATVLNYAAPGRALGLFETRYSDLVFGPFLYHNKAAQFGELAFPVALWLIVNERTGRVAAALAAVALAGLIVATGSRAGIFVLLLETVVIAVVCLRRKATWMVLAVPATVVVATAIFGWELAAERVTIDASRDLRIPILASSFEMAARHWLSGSGLGTWSIVYPGYARFDAHRFINQAHCDWVQWLVEGGILAPCLLLGMLAAAVRASRVEWWTLGVVFVWIHALVDYPMRQAPAFSSLQFAFWGGAVALMHRAGQSSQFLVRPAKWSRIKEATEVGA